MSAEIDDRCPTCETECTFSTKQIKGHSKNHRIATFPICGEMVTGMCEDC